MTKYKSDYLDTGCRDCGRRIIHCHPLSNVGKSEMFDRYDNVHVTIYYDYNSRHYLHIIKGAQEKMFFSCMTLLNDLVRDGEIKKVLEWAAVPEAQIQGMD